MYLMERTLTHFLKLETDTKTIKLDSEKFADL